MKAPESVLQPVFLTLLVWRLPQHLQNSPILWTLMKLNNSVLISSHGVVQTPQSERLSPARLSPLRTASPQAPVVTYTSHQLTTYLSSYKAFLSFRNCLVVCEVWKVQCGASVLVEFEVSTLPAHGGLRNQKLLGTSPFGRCLNLRI